MPNRTLVLILLACLMTHADASDSLPDSIQSSISEMVHQGISDGQMAGAVVLIASQENILFHQAYGHRLIDSSKLPMELDTVFDLASITKPVATAMSVMHLVQQGKIDLDQPVSMYLPNFTGDKKELITVSELLLHTGGLIPDNSLNDYLNGPSEAWMKICELNISASRGERFMYSDVGYIVLGKLVEKVSGQPLNQFALENLFKPLGMRETMFLPQESLRLRSAATEKRDGQWMQGEVHDPRAYLLEGVAGHAGLFSTANDLARFGQSMLGKGRNHPNVMNAQTFQTMTIPRQTPRGTRTYGWDHQSPYSGNRGTSLSESAFGHGGFTGTVLWIDPGKNRVIIFLSSRLHPDGKGSVNAIAGKIATLIGQHAQ